MADVHEPEARPCEGCGAPAGQPCNPHMGCRDMATEPQYGAAQIICEVGWRPYGRTFCRRVSREAYLRDLAYAEDLALDVHEWRGEDPDGKPMVVSWVVTSNGRLLAAYVIQGRA